MSIYGYCRISRPQQSIERQIRNIKAAYPDAVIVEEVYTRTSMDRRGWNRLFAAVKEGDAIVFDSVSRMSGSADDGFAAYEELYRRGVRLVFLKEPHINTDTYKAALSRNIELTGESVDYILDGVNKYLMALAREQIRLAFEQSEKEVSDLRQRTREGIETARLAGKQIGREQGMTFETRKARRAKDLIRRYSIDYGGFLADPELIQLCGVGRNTFYRYKKQITQGG